MAPPPKRSRAPVIALVVGVCALVLAGLGFIALTALQGLAPGKTVDAAPAQLASNDVLLDAACRGTPDDLRRALTTIASPAQAQVLPAVLGQCIAPADPSGEMFRVLLPSLAGLPQPAAGPAPLCTALRVLHEHHRSDLLAMVADRGYPLACPARGDAQPSWFPGLRSEVNTPVPIDPPTQAKMLAWLQFLQQRGVKLGERGGVFNECMLDRVVAHHSAEIVTMALDAGCDPRTTASGPHDWPPVARWAQRRFATPACQRGVPLSAEQLAALTARMPALRPEDINRPERANGRTLLHIVADAASCEPDGGAAVFTHLLERGADLGLGDFNGSTFLGSLQSLQPALLAELRKLSDAQIERMAFPISSTTGQRGKPLLEVARSRGNLALAELLCERRIKGCQ